MRTDVNPDEVLCITKSLPLEGKAGELCEPG